MNRQEEALRALAAGLDGRGIAARVFATNVIVAGENGRELVVVCSRGVFRWGMGEEIGPIDDVDAAVRHVAAASAS
ncbi:hypothetical protein AGRA3207_006686 [Actinomadura graeca]|uniref:Uncharacterized protein n=1 Tax=Actinomadura graeca TaxID=2750812 RepID=A0ABX8R2Y4_9ACTN|nr:hypothetical protein [Actinomadura graeca]QXJ25218.1 hypothetical protein AGRA3207_006686 [Actinomadura graeca]